jgi:hypothetical protein
VKDEKIRSGTYPECIAHPYPTSHDSTSAEPAPGRSVTATEGPIQIRAGNDD